MSFGVDHFRQFGDGHTVAYRLGKIIGESLRSLVRHWPLHEGSSNRIRAIKQDHLDSRLRRSLQEISDSSLVGIETYARIGDIDDHGVQSLQNIEGRSPGRIAPD